MGFSFGSRSGTVEAQPGGGSSGGSGPMAKLLSGMQSAGVDMTGESAPTEEMKKRLRELGIEVYKKGGKVKKYADGGMTQQPTYPFYGNQPQAGGQNGGMNQTFNMQPQANADANQQPQQRFKKGGKVSSASSRADGCAIRGKTRA